MKIISCTSLLVAVVLAIGCASTHNGARGKSIGKKPIAGLMMSAKNIENNKNEPFQLIEITIENQSDEWLRLHRTQLHIENAENSKISPVVGADLKSWSEAKKFQLLKDSHNTEMAQSALLIGGTVLAGSSDKNAALLGSIMAIGTAGWVVADSIQFSLDKATQSEKVPENHVFHSATIPGKSFIRRWILVNRPSGVQLKNVVLSLETVDGQRDYVDIALTL